MHFKYLSVRKLYEYRNTPTWSGYDNIPPLHLLTMKPPPHSYVR